jgi:DNA mismatch endonuclease (patch repair protein)
MNNDTFHFFLFNFVCFCLKDSDMTDIMTKEQRHRCMQAIRANDTKPEMIVRRYLFACGMRFRIHCENLPGKPDLVLPKYHTAIFINGCFWHGHQGCKFFRLPKTNELFWTNKIAKNHERDIRVRAELKQLGWNTMVVWECQLKPNVRAQNLEEIYNDLLLAYMEIHKLRHFPDSEIVSVEEDCGQAAEENGIYLKNKI